MQVYHLQALCLTVNPWCHCHEHWRRCRKTSLSFFFLTCVCLRWACMCGHMYVGACSCKCGWRRKPDISGVFLHHFPPFSVRCGLSGTHSSLFKLVWLASLLWGSVFLLCLPSARMTGGLSFPPSIYRDCGNLNSILHINTASALTTETSAHPKLSCFYWVLTEKGVWGSCLYWHSGHCARKIARLQSEASFQETKNIKVKTKSINMNASGVRIHRHFCSLLHIRPYWTHFLRLSFL